MDADLAKPLGKRSLVPAQVVCVGVFRGQSGRKFAGGRGGWQKKPFRRCLVYKHRPNRNQHFAFDCDGRGYEPAEQWVPSPS